jgi:hypothetical protein
MKEATHVVVVLTLEPSFIGTHECPLKIIHYSMHIHFFTFFSFIVKHKWWLYIYILKSPKSTRQHYFFLTNKSLIFIHNTSYAPSDFFVIGHQKMGMWRLLTWSRTENKPPDKNLMLFLEMLHQGTEVTSCTWEAWLANARKIPISFADPPRHTSVPETWEFPSILTGFQNIAQ